MQKTKLVFNQVIAYQLRDRGFDIVTKFPNKNAPQLDVFVFELTDKFSEQLSILIKK